MIENRWRELVSRMRMEGTEEDGDSGAPYVVGHKSCYWYSAFACVLVTRVGIF